MAKIVLNEDNSVPIPVQLFLWQESNPFLKQQFGNLTDASSIIFHRIFVQNILHGLSPNLTDCISTIPRWLLTKIALPHVMQSCASVIKQNSSLSEIDIRLFHTLHYLMLYSNEINDQYSCLNTIELFIYLFIPYIETYFHNNEKEFLSNTDLNQGMRLIWQALFEYNQPNIRLFNSFIKSIEQNQQSMMPLSMERSISVYQSISYNANIQAPIVDINSICSMSNLSRMTISSHTPGTHDVIVSVDQSRSILNEYVQFASYFDISIIRTLYSPSWSTDGYIWCLKYIEKRLINIFKGIKQKNHLIPQKSIKIEQRNHVDKHDIEYLDLAYSFSSKEILMPMKRHSLSDRNINYNRLENLKRVPGSNGYINQNGTINLNSIVAGIHAVICKQGHLKICELSLNILDILLDFNFLSAIEYDKFQLTIDIILRILKHLGCIHCRINENNSSNDHLRNKIRLLFNRLYLIDHNQFKICFLHFISHDDPLHIIEILHALCSYCLQATHDLVHYAPYIQLRTMTHKRQTYSNHFDRTHLVNGPHGIEGFILNIIFKSFITRLNMLDEHLLETENLLLYAECRTFLMFIKENHGGIFRSTAFSCLIDSPKQNSTNTVDLTIVRTGLLRLNFLFEACPPGSLPDPQFLHSLLFLDAPIISKAAFLVECAHYVHRCSLGQWPEWMRLNLITTFRPHDTFNRRTHGNIYHIAAARMFYIWGEALALQLEKLLAEETNEICSCKDTKFDDYYNETIVNHSGHDCPYSLKLVVCLLLYEITVFLRETYPTLPKISLLSTDRSSDIACTNFNVSSCMNKRKSSANERHISFAADTENDPNDNHGILLLLNDIPSTDGNSTASFMTHKTGSITSSTSKIKPTRQTSGKLRKPSKRIRDNGRNINACMRARRSSHPANFSKESDRNRIKMKSSNDDLDQENFDKLINRKPYPWIKVLIRIFNQIDLTCSSYYYDKQTRSCQNLMKALSNMYRSTNNKHFNILSNYLEKKVGSLIQIPLMIFCKTSVLLDAEHYSQILVLTWELLLDRNEELAACAATMLILIAARARHLINKLFDNEMNHKSAMVRYKSILKFQILWRFRYQFWIRLEDDAQSMMKILPPTIEFVLPSPPLGIANLQAVDPPWMSYAKTLVQQVALNQEEFKSVVTTSKTRKKYQQQFIHSALMIEEISKRVARENFPLSTISILQSASYQSLVHQTKDDEDEVYCDDDRIIECNVQRCQTQGIFPSEFSSAIFYLVDMLEDENIIANGATISTAARKALSTCVLDEPTLFIRFFFEKISNKQRRITSLNSLHRLMLHLNDIPAQFAHAIFNYVLGLLSSTIRSPFDDAQNVILEGLTLLWQIIPHLHGLILKDLKQILRKEQAEMMILITGNLPSTKCVIIHGPDPSKVPTQVIVCEETQFSHILQESLEFFGIEQEKREHYYLIDMKTQDILIADTYVRDFYLFRRNIYPQLSLIYLEKKRAQDRLETMSICLKTRELSKVLFARYLIENTPFNQTHNFIKFFHDELVKCPLFLRKTLESDYNLYTTISNKEILSLDMLHKYNWTKLIASIFFNMNNKTTTTWDIHLFISVINGSFILHCEDLLMLRFCLATYINIVKHFRHIFATNGYLLIMPTILRIYSNIQSNPMLKQSIEYCCQQFFLLHRIPFILQMLGSISQIIDYDEQNDITDSNKIQSIYLLRLLLSFEQTDLNQTVDDYSILELVKNDLLSINSIDNHISFEREQLNTISTKIQSLDFCYENDETKFTLLNCFDICVTVVAYAPDSIRSSEMLNIIDILLPKYLQYIKDQTNKHDLEIYGQDELKIIEKLSITMRTLISASEPLMKTFISSKYDALTGANYKYSRTSYQSPSIAIDEDSNYRYTDERSKKHVQDTDEHQQIIEFRCPRDKILCIISNFIYLSTLRLNELMKLLNDQTIIFRIKDIFDIKFQTRLVDIVYALLKLTYIDPGTISCRGIQSYFQKCVPYINWDHEQMRATFNFLLRRIDRMFYKICKKPIIKRFFDWESAAEILNGIYLSIDCHPGIVRCSNHKLLISGSISLLLNENNFDTNRNSFQIDRLIFPKRFSQVVIKLVGQYLLMMKNQGNLEILTNHCWSTMNISSAINYLLYFLLPLIFWAENNLNSIKKFHPTDISYITTILLNSIKSSSKSAVTMGLQTGSFRQYVNHGKQQLYVTDISSANSSFSQKSLKQLKDILQTIALLGFKIFLLCFDKHLKREWQRILDGIKSLCSRQSNASSNFLSFIDFIVSYKTSIYVILRPILMQYIHTITTENHRDYQIIINIRQKMSYEKLVQMKPRCKIFEELKQELNQLIIDVTDKVRPSDVSETCLINKEKVRFDIDTPTQINDPNKDEIKNDSNDDHFLQQHTTNSTAANALTKARTKKIDLKHALNILKPYQIRYKARYIDTGYHQSSSSSYPSMSLFRSATIFGDRSTITKEISPKLRTFHRWKRNTFHLDRSRLMKNVWQSDINMNQ